MRQATIRWMIFLSALLAVGPAASFILRPLRGPDGSLAATPLVSTAPALGLLTGLLACAVALGMGLLACRIAGFRSALSATGLVLAWAAWRTGDVDQLIRTAGSAAPLRTLALEGAIFGAIAFAIAAVLSLVGRIADHSENGDIAHGSPKARLLGGSSAPVIIAVALAAAAAATWFVAATPLKGQAVIAAAAGGIAAGTAVRLLVPTAPLAPIFIAFWALAILAPISGSVFASNAGVLVDAYRNALFPLAHATPMDIIAGAFLGIPLGAAWGTSAGEKAPHAPAASSAS